jgi:indolepyruvate ferredoxin oxidoreductase beta subunit
MNKNILLAGVGGQGTILAAKLMTIGLVQTGYDVKMSEIHGMSQRGGAVTSQIRYSDSEVFSPVIEKGGADMIVAFEEMEALRNLDFLKPGGRILVNTLKIPSMTVLTGEEDYPDDVISIIKKSVPDTITINATDMAGKLGNSKAANMILLGATVELMDLNHIDWEKIIRENVKEKFIDINVEAFKCGLGFKRETL